MPYTLMFTEPVRTFLRSHAGLSREGRVRLFTNLDSDLRHLGDVFINDPARHLSDSPLRFWYSILFLDPSRPGSIQQYWFVVNASGAAAGVLQVEYADEGGPPSGLTL